VYFVARKEDMDHQAPESAPFTSAERHLHFLSIRRQNAITLARAYERLLGKQFTLELEHLTLAQLMIFVERTKKEVEQDPVANVLLSTLLKTA
jgi:hypothetical protein